MPELWLLYEGVGKLEGNSNVIVDEMSGNSNVMVDGMSGTEVYDGCQAVEDDGVGVLR